MISLAYFHKNQVLWFLIVDEVQKSADDISKFCEPVIDSLCEQKEYANVSNDRIEFQKYMTRKIKEKDVFEQLEYAVRQKRKGKAYSRAQ